MRSCELHARDLARSPQTCQFIPIRFGQATVRPSPLVHPALAAVAISQDIVPQGPPRGGDLNAAQLQGAHLVGAHLAMAELGWANLRSAHLEEADLRETHLGGAVLTAAHLEGADLGSATWRERSSPVPTWRGPTSVRPA